MHEPYDWVVLRIESEDSVIYKVLAGFPGGYLDGDYWRLNSGITDVELGDNGIVYFYGNSGSCYKVNEANYHLSMRTLPIYTQMSAENTGYKVTMLDKDTDWGTLV